MFDPLRRDLPSDKDTALLGEDVAAALRPGDLLALRGDLGMGKTSLARSIIRALADDADLEVPSPTFTLVQGYEGRLPVQHFDLYRLIGAEEIDELGLDEAVGTGVAIVEWPERAGHRLPGNVIEIALTEQGAGRGATISANDEAISRLRRSLAARQFLGDSGLEAAARRHLIGDASTRAYETIRANGNPPRILMNAPRQPDGPPIRDGKPYSQIAHLAETVTPFVAIDRALRRAGFAAPEIHAADLDEGFLLIEHLGAEGINAGGCPVAERYLAAAQLLAAVHGRNWAAEQEAAPGVIHRIPDYDRGAMAIETELLTDWYLPHATGRRLDEDQIRAYRAGWGELFDRLASAEKSLVLRDFHSPNIIWRGDRRGHDRIGLIDFQDALIGPCAYDVASLALDARVTIAPDLERAILDAYCAARGAGFDRAGFEEAYAIMAAQRNSKIIGIFVRLNDRDGKPNYLKHLPRIRDYLARAFEHPALAGLRDFYRRAGIVGELTA